MSALPKIIDMNDQSLFQTDNRCKPPDTLRYEDLLVLPGVCYDLLEGVYDNVVVVFEGYSHRRN